MTPRSGCYRSPGLHRVPHFKGLASSVHGIALPARSSNCCLCFLPTSHLYRRRSYPSVATLSIPFMFTLLDTVFTSRSRYIYHILLTSSTPPEISVVSPHAHHNIQHAHCSSKPRTFALGTKRTLAVISLPLVIIYILAEMFLLSGWRVSKSSDDPAVMYTSRSQVPDYAKLWDLEDHLPQHNLDLPHPEGRNG